MWNSRKVASWSEERIGKSVGVQRGWEYLRLSGRTPHVPRPRQGRPSGGIQGKLATRVAEGEVAYPHAKVALWTMDQHRLGLRPVLRRVGTLRGPRPVVPVYHRYQWRYG